MKIYALYLNYLVGKNIRDICDKGRYVADDGLHCAHFIDHLFGLKYGITCAGVRGGVTVNVSDVLSHSENFREFNKGEKEAEAGCLIYVAPTNEVDVENKTINGSLRHVGIYLNGWVWHYENHHTCERVERHVIEQTGPGFPKFKNRYIKEVCGLWVSDFPSGSQWNSKFYPFKSHKFHLPTDKVHKKIPGFIYG
jgi:hypothetical protein